MTLLHAEWTRLASNRVVVVTACATLVLLIVSAIDGGNTARLHREGVEARQYQWTQRLDALRDDRSIVGAPAEAQSVATATFEFGRTEAPAAPRPALGGLALSARHFETLPGNVSVTLESRYMDSRRTETIGNPLLATLGVPDFSVVVALLLPLLIIGMTHGLVQEMRELGIWRLVRAQTAQPWRSFGWALGIRWLLAIGVAAIPSSIALILDPGGTSTAGLLWILGIALCAFLWVLMAGCASLLPVSSIASTLILLSIWLVTSFATPPLLASLTSEDEKPRSQLVTLHTIRGIQQDVEMRERELLDRWYEANPEHMPAASMEHTFPVTFVPRYVEQDRHIVPMMREFEELRSRRAERVEPFMALAPGPSLVLLADSLAGSSAQHQNAYMQAIAELEQEWRRVLIPGVMSYQGLTDEDVNELALIGISSIEQRRSHAVLIALAAGVFVWLLLLVSCHRRLLVP